MGDRLSSFLNTHVAQFVGVKLGQEPVSTGEGEQGKADQGCENEHEKPPFSLNSLTNLNKKRYIPFQYCNEIALHF